MSDELKKIFPEEIYVLQSGEEVSVSPVPFRKLGVFGVALASLFDKIQASGSDAFDSPEKIGALFSVAFDEIITLMAMILNKDISWFDNITVEDGIGLLTIMLRQNFNENTKKKLELLLPRIQSVST